MSIPGYDRYWLDYQARHDPQWRDEEYDEQDDDAFWNEVDYEVDENILERGETDE